MPFHLYLHLPYCRRRCPYCDFYKKVPAPGELDSFVVLLLKEIALAGKQFPAMRGPVATVYLGGGTPSLHSPRHISSLLEAVAATWGIDELAEITLEINPGTADLGKFTGFRSAGINRLSLGGQSFSARKLRSLFRDHSATEISEAAALSRLAGFGNLSLDLIFGLPGETLKEWGEDLEAALALAPEHVSLYNLEFHEGTPFDKWRHEGRIIPLTGELEAELYHLAIEFLTRQGYEHYEVSNFALPGYRSRHNSAYWQRKPYLGLGPSAHSFDGTRVRHRNIADVAAYARDIATGRLPIIETARSADSEYREEWISLQLRMKEGVRFADAEATLGPEVARALWHRARDLPAGTSEISDTHFHLTASGWFKENSILLWLFDGLKED